MYTQTNMFLLVNRIYSLWLAFSPPIRQFMGSNPGQIKLETMKLVIAAKNASQSRTKSDWLTQNQENMSEWSDISIRRRLFHATYLSADNCFTELELLNLTLEERLVDCKAHIINISSNWFSSMI